MYDLKTVNIGFIGYGNMAGATARGLIFSGAVDAGQIHGCANNYDKLCEKAKADGINPYKDAVEVVRASDIIVIGVKPHLVKGVMEPLADDIKDKVVISLAAGLFYDELNSILPEAHFVATAPNTPVSVCEGVFLCEDRNRLMKEEREFIDNLLGHIGLVGWMNKDTMGIAGVISGCAPAFVAMLMEALQDVACKYGLTRSASYDLIAQMLVGTGKMALTEKKHPGEMKDAVCSPSGITIVGVTALEEKGFRHALIHAVDEIEKKKSK